MLTILEKSVLGKVTGSIHFHKWNSSNNLANTLTKTFWEVKTSVRKFNFIRYLKLKMLMEEISESELRCLLDAPGVLNDDLFVDALRAKQSGIPDKILWQRVEKLTEIFDLPTFSPNLYYTLRNNITYELRELRSPIRQVKKYSGYVRNSSAVGSKKQSKTSKPEPEIFEWNSGYDRDYYYFLTVGEFISGLPGDIFFTLKRAKSSKRNS